MNIKHKWNQLHAQPRFCPLYPNDRVVAWTFRNFAKNRSGDFTLLDLGCGGGRHAVFFSKEGYRTVACDFSTNGVKKTRLRAAAAELDMRLIICGAEEIGLRENLFDGVLCYGVLYYLSCHLLKKAIDEIRRILKPGGKALIVTRTMDDSRLAAAEKIGVNTYRITRLDDGAPSNAETGMTMSFLGYGDIKEIFRDFKSVQIDRATITSNNGAFKDDDWLVEVVK